MDKYLSLKIKRISFILIIMVIYIHSYNLTTKFLGNTETLQGMDLNSFIQEFISNGVTRIAVPLFFIISGYLFFLGFKPTASNFIIKYKKRFFSLVIPFMFWSIWGLILFWVMQSIPLSKSFFTNDLVKDYSFTKVIDTIFIHPLPYQLWFLIELIKYVIISPIIYIYISKCSYYSLIPFLYFWFFEKSLIALNTEGILFFLIGSLLAIKSINLNNIKARNKYESCTVFFIWIFILIIKTYFIFQNVNFSIYLHKISIIIGVLALWFMYDFCVKNEIKKTKVFCITDFTFFIYASHEPILTIIKKAVLRIIGVSSYSNLIVYLIAPILTIIITLIIGSFLKTYAKRIYTVITGGRVSH